MSQLDNKAVMYELETAITARNGNLTPYEVRMQTKRKILTFHNCVCELVTLSSKHLNTVVDAVMRALMVEGDFTRCFKRNPRIEYITAMNIDIEEACNFAGGFTKIRAKLTTG